MIRYALKCDRDHAFESWFQSADAFDTLRTAGHVTCAVCGSDSVRKAVMAPQVSVRDAEPAPAPPPSLGGTRTDLERALAAIRRKVEDTSDYVGRDFAREARAIHDGTATERPIWGEARPEDARALIEDGVPVAPLPFIPSRKAN